MRRLVATATVALCCLATASGAGESQLLNVDIGVATSLTYDVGRPDTFFELADERRDFNAVYYASRHTGDDLSANIDLLQFRIHGERGRLSYAAKIDFGRLAPIAENTLSLDGDDIVGIQEAYFTYSGERYAITAGRYPTLLGYEVLEPWGNAHISRSRAWDLQPIAHDGILVRVPVGRTEIALGYADSFHIGVTDVDGNSARDHSVLASVEFATDDFDLKLAGIFGEAIQNINELFERDVLLVNAVASGRFGIIPVAMEANYREIREKFTRSLDGESWSFTGYTELSLEPVALRLRAEYGDYDRGSRFTDFGRIWSVAATLATSLADAVEFRLEYLFAASIDDNLFDYDEESVTDDKASILQAQLVFAPTLSR